MQLSSTKYYQNESNNVQKELHTTTKRDLCQIYTTCSTFKNQLIKNVDTFCLAIFRLQRILWRLCEEAWKKEKLLAPSPPFLLIEIMWLIAYFAPEESSTQSPTPPGHFSWTLSYLQCEWVLKVTKPDLRYFLCRICLVNSAPHFRVRIVGIY